MVRRYQPGVIPIAGAVKLASDLSGLKAGGADILSLGVTVH